MQSSNDPLRCTKCGEMMVVYYFKLAGVNAVLKVGCPRDKIRKPLRLPMNTRDQWIRQVAESIYRCLICGQPIRDPANVGRSGRWIVLTLVCPTHGTREAQRHILDTLYPIIQNLHQNPNADITAPSTLNPPMGAYPPPPPSPNYPSPNYPSPPPPPYGQPPPPPPYGRPPPPPPYGRPPPPPPYGQPPPGMYPPPPPPAPTVNAPPVPEKLVFCSDCGAALQPGALFCVACGREIIDDEKYDHI